MAKHRKKTSKDIPAKGRLQDMADALWSLSVLNDWANRCVVCGHAKCHAHHLTPRQFDATRYSLENGIALCARHHMFDPEIAPHQNAAGWLQWLEENHPKRAKWLSENTRPPFHGTKTPQWYMEHIMRLRQYVEPEDFERICGVRFSQYLLEHLDSE